MAEPAVEMRGIVKRYPGVVANDHVDFAVDHGEIIGLLGENGAGKSTLMKLLYGLERPDEGEILIGGDTADLRSPLDAINSGIGMVHQHFMLIPTMTVAENVALGLRSSRGVRTDLDVVSERLESLGALYGLRVDPSALVRHLSVGEQQRVEILKALYRDVSVLILDEPTAVLTPQEVDEFFGFLRQMRDRGNSIVFISHKLYEVVEITSQVTVLRDGRNVGTVATAETTKEDLARRMVGREFTLQRELPPKQPDAPRLTLDDVHVNSDRGQPVVRGVTLDVCGGEIVGISGVSGNGQMHLAEAIAGLRRIEFGSTHIDGWKATNRSVRSIVDHGLAYVPEERNRDGMIKDFSISENLIMRDPGNAAFATRGFFRFGRIERHASRIVDEFDVKTPSTSSLIGNLSGGNAQKVILARELSRQPGVLVVAQPTRGLDIGAAEFVRDQLVEQREAGTAVLLISEDLDELLALSDRVAVLFDGMVMGVVDRADAEVDLIGLMMAGEPLEQAATSVASANDTVIAAARV